MPTEISFFDKNREVSYKDKVTGKRTFLLSAISLIFAVLVLPISQFAQQPDQTDPFYLRLLEKAQKSFLAKDYEDAARDFEIASFGLTGAKTLKAKAYVYLSLSQYYLKDMKSSEKYLREAADLMGDQGFESLKIYESALPDLEKLLALFKMRPAEQEASPQPHQAQDKPLKAKPPTPAKPEEKAPEKTPAQEPAQIPQQTLAEIKEGDLAPLDMVDTPPVVLKRVLAGYPAAARAFGIEGTVMVNALISEKGDVIKTEIIKGIKGVFGFNQSAQSAVHQWKFEPASIKGIKVRVWMLVAIVFKKQE